MPKKPKLTAKPGEQTVRLGKVSVHHGDSLKVYDEWLPPAVIISDGPYGLGKFPGEPHTPDGLAEWYAPHAAEWARHAEPFTTLWFWNSEIGWAKSHNALEMHGWQYQETAIWDKGIAHIAGNVNSKTIRGLPVVTEVAVRYTRKLELPNYDGSTTDLKAWVRSEWERSGLPFYQSNEACGVKNAATRKYLTKCHLWYFPPGEAIEAMSKWCMERGQPTDRPYFSLDGKNPPNGRAWDRLRAKWNHVHGLTNVWQSPPVHGSERVKNPDGPGYLHANQKPLALMRRQIEASTDAGDVVWEPFGGLMSGTVAALQSGRKAHVAELNSTFFRAGLERVRAVMSSTEATDAA